MGHVVRGEDTPGVDRDTRVGPRVDVVTAHHADLVDDVVTQSEDVAVDLLGDGFHRRVEQLGLEVEDVQGEVLGRHREGHVREVVEGERGARLGRVLDVDAVRAAVLLGREGQRLADGDGVADLTELGLVVPVDQVGHHRVLVEGGEGRTGDDVGSEERVRHGGLSPGSFEV